MINQPSYITSYILLPRTCYFFKLSSIYIAFCVLAAIRSSAFISVRTKITR